MPTISGTTKFGPHVQDVVQIEVMPGQLEGVGVLAGVGRVWHGAPTRWGHRPKRLGGPGQLHPGLGVEVAVGGEPPAGQQGRKEQTMAPARSQLDVGSWFRRTKGTLFQDVMAVQLLGVKQYFTSSFKFNLRSRRSVRGGFKKENMLSRDDRNKNLAATVLSSSA